MTAAVHLNRCGFLFQRKHCHAGRFPVKMILIINRRKSMKIIRKIMIILSAMMVLLGGMAAVKADDVPTFSQEEFTADVIIHEWTGTEYSPADFEEEYVLLIFGRQTCGNTQNMIWRAETLVNDGYSLRPVVMLVDDYNAPMSVEEFAEDHPLLTVSDTYSSNNSLGFSLMSRAGISGNMLPFVYLMNSERKIIASGTGPEHITKFANLIKGLPADSGGGGEEPGTKEYINFSFNGTYHQKEARSMLEMINAFRTGEDAWAWNSSDTKKVKYENLQPLKYDYGLERAAMIRAKELAMMFSHTRPDGTSCFTAYEDGYFNNGENIAAGFTSAEAVFIGWREDDDSYSGQGHRRNMLGGYTAVGIACVEVEGRKYWVQEFSGSLLDTDKVEYPEEEQSMQVTVLKDFCSVDVQFVDNDYYYWGARETIQVGEEMEIPYTTAWLTADGQTLHWIYTTRSYSSTDESVAKVENGQIIGVGEGECDIIITAEYLGLTGSATLHITVTGHEHAYVLDHWQWASDYSSAKLFLVCSEDRSHTLEADAVITKEEKKATCQSEGWVKYTAAASADGQTFTDQKTVTLAKSDHDWGEPEYTWSSDYKKVTASITCRSGGESVSSTVTTSYTVIKQPTKTAAGTGRYTASFSDSRFKTQTKDVVIPKLTEETPTSIRLNITNKTIATKSSLQLTAAVSPSAADQSVIWSSDNESIATVDSTGKVTAHRYGKTVIRAVSAVDPTIEAMCVITTRYYDVFEESLYYYKPVYWAADRNITKGYDNVYFGPKNFCTREAVVTFLWRAAGQPSPENMNSPFSDVQDPSKYYYKAVLWAAEQNITKGYSDGTFRPGATCLREHVVTFLWRYAKEPAPKTSKNPFNDVKSSDYYYKAVLWANENGIAKGYSAGEHAGGFGPKLDCLREHVVTFLYRLLK